MELVNTGCAPDGAICRCMSTGFARCILIENAISSRVSSIAACMTCPPVRVHIMWAPGGATCYILDFTVVSRLQVTLCVLLRSHINIVS